MPARSVADIRRGLGVPDLITMQPGAHEAPKPPPDPLEEATRWRQTILGQNLMRSTAAEVQSAAQAEMMEAQLRTRKLQLDIEEVETRLEELHRSRRPAGDGDGQTNALLVTILEALRDDKRTLAEQNERLRNELNETVRGELQSLRERLLQQPANGHRPPETAPRGLRQELEEVKGIWEFLRDLAPSRDPHADTGRTLEETQRLLEAKEAHELRMLEFDERRERWRREMEHEERRIEEDSRRGKAVTDTLGRAIPALQQMANGWLESRVGVAPAQPAHLEPPYEPGTVQQACPNCHTLIAFPPGHDRAACPGCGSGFQLRYDYGPPPEQPTTSASSAVEPPPTTPPPPPREAPISEMARRFADVLA